MATPRAQAARPFLTRDVFPFRVTSGHCPEGKTEKMDCWQMPEVPNNIDTPLHTLVLRNKEKTQILSFLKTPREVSTPPPPNNNTLKGRSMTGGNPSTKGNKPPPPPPPLSPCTSVICGVQP